MNDTKTEEVLAVQTYLRSGKTLADLRTHHFVYTTFRNDSFVVLAAKNLDTSPEAACCDYIVLTTHTWDVACRRTSVAYQRAITCDLVQNPSQYQYTVWNEGAQFALFHFDGAWQFVVLNGQNLGITQIEFLEAVNADTLDAFAQSLDPTSVYVFHGTRKQMRLFAIVYANGSEATGVALFQVATKLLLDVERELISIRAGKSIVDQLYLTPKARGAIAQLSGTSKRFYIKTPPLTVDAMRPVNAHALYVVLNDPVLLRFAALKANFDATKERVELHLKSFVHEHAIFTSAIDWGEAHWQQMIDIAVLHEISPQAVWARHPVTIAELIVHREQELARLRRESTQRSRPSQCCLIM